MRSGAVCRPAPELHRGDTVLLSYPTDTTPDLIEYQTQVLAARGVFAMGVLPGQQVLAVLRGRRTLGGV